MNHKKFLPILLLAPLLVLTGCLKRKKAETKKTALQGKGIRLKKEGNDNSLDKADLEEFLLAEEEEPFHHKKMIIDTETQKHQVISWKDDEEATVLQPIYFNFDAYAIRQDQQKALKDDIKAAKKITAQKNVGLRIEGHADKHFISETYNLAVSQKRATKVAQEFAEAGIDKELLKPVGFGANKLAVNDSGKNEANRRVEFATIKA